MYNEIFKYLKKYIAKRVLVYYVVVYTVNLQFLLIYIFILLQLNNKLF